MPIIDANIDVTGEPRLQGKFNRSMIVEKGGQKIGIVGFITTDTAFISDAGEYMLHFKNKCIFTLWSSSKHIETSKQRRIDVDATS